MKYISYMKDTTQAQGQLAVQAALAKAVTKKYGDGEDAKVRFAHDLDVSPRTAYRLTSTKKEGSMKTLIRACEFMNVDASGLVKPPLHNGGGARQKDLRTMSHVPKARAVKAIMIAQGVEHQDDISWGREMMELTAEEIGVSPNTLSKMAKRPDLVFRQKSINALYEYLSKNDRGTRLQAPAAPKRRVVSSSDNQIHKDLAEATRLLARVAARLSEKV